MGENTLRYGAGEIREGEEELAFDPAQAAADAHLVFIGTIRSPWKSRSDCPKNMAEARAAGGGATIELLPAFQRGLAGLGGFSHVVILSWLAAAPRNLIVQRPRHLAEPRGTFALRSPARPNPIGLHVARLVAIEPPRGVLELDAIDVLDGTPLIDVKPYYASVDAVPEATRT